MLPDDVSIPPLVETRLIQADMPTIWSVVADTERLKDWYFDPSLSPEIVKDELFEGGHYEYRIGGDRPQTIAGSYLEVWPPVRYLRTQIVSAGMPWQCAFRLTPTGEGTEAAMITHVPEAVSDSVRGELQVTYAAALNRLAGLAEAEPLG